MEKRLFTVKEAAHYLARHPDNIYEMISNGELPCITVGIRGIRIDRKELDAWIQAKIDERAA